MNTILRLAACAASLLIAACTAMTPAADAPNLDGTAWVLASLPGQTLVAGSAPTLRFEGGRASGTDGCNRYTNTYTAKGAALEFGARGASTMMACPPDRMKLAEAFSGALARTRSYRVADRRLELLGADGAVVATFAAQSQALAGTSWQVTNYNNGRQAVVGILDGTQLTLAFSADGRIAGSAGCNRYMGTYTQEGGKLTLRPAGTTRMACPKPEGVMDQEREFLKALETVATARFEGDSLELRTASDALAAMLVRGK